MSEKDLTKLRWRRLFIVTLLAAIGVFGFTRLGVWQVERLHWKLDLIDRVDSRIHAEPVAAPGQAAWSRLSAEADEYRPVRLSGRFLNEDEVLIYTPSNFGPADWVLTPFARSDGTIVMVNRGVVPEERAQEGDFDRIERETTVTGLLRMSEDKGWLFSRKNDPDNGLWYRRDIGSITAAKGYDAAAPYFVDVLMDDPQGWPRGGQTVVQFRNAHLSYALTWFALALVVLAGYGLVLRMELKRAG